MAFFPETMKLLKPIKDISMISFSRMDGNTHIDRHLGYQSNVYRVVYGISIPAPGKSTLHVINNKGSFDRVEMAEGKAIIFDDSKEHYAENNSDQERIVLLFDFLQPGKEFIPPASNKEMQVLFRMHHHKWQKMHLIEAKNNLIL